MLPREQGLLRYRTAAEIQAAHRQWIASDPICLYHIVLYKNMPIRITRSIRAFGAWTSTRR